jgi:hypothetical protein
VSVIKTRLKQRSTGDFVDAELHTSLGLEDMMNAEAQWSPARIEVFKQFLRGKVPDERWPQSFHWNWALKAVRLRRMDIGGALSPLRLMGIRQSGRWQALVLLNSVGHTTRLPTKGLDLLYIHYIESAPWNLELTDILQQPEFRCGRQLMDAVVRLSLAMDFEGRVGLHALEQSEVVYQRWGMTDLGKDPEDLDLRYFEMSEQRAKTFLQENDNYGKAH